MLEKIIEKKVCDYAKKCGWLAYKFVSPGQRGVPDRMFVKDGHVIFIEFKQLGKKATALQNKHLNRLRSHLIEAYVIDSVADGLKLLENHDATTGKSFGIPKQGG